MANSPHTFPTTWGITLNEDAEDMTIFTLLFATPEGRGRALELSPCEDSLLQGRRPWQATDLWSFH